MSRKMTTTVVLALLVVGGVGAYAYANEPPVLDGFYSPEQREARELRRLEKEFPQTIGGYTLYSRSVDKIKRTKECAQVAGENVCQQIVVAEYRDAINQKAVFIHLSKAQNNDSRLKGYLEKVVTADSLGVYSIVRVEKHELGWFPQRDYTFILTQEAVYLQGSDGSESYDYPNTATGNNPVTQYFLEKYPPKANS